MSRLAWHARMVLGCLCWWALMLLPISPFSRGGLWLVKWAGFFAFSEGYELDRERGEVTKWTETTG